MTDKPTQSKSELKRQAVLRGEPMAGSERLTADDVIRRIVATYERPAPHKELLAFLDRYVRQEHERLTAEDCEAVRKQKPWHGQSRQVWELCCAAFEKEVKRNG